jgi:segregation and condensation protein B
MAVSDETLAAEAHESKGAEKIRTAVEAVLFATSRPVPLRELAELLEAAEEQVASALGELAAACVVEDRGIRLEKVAGGWRYVTRPEFDGLLRKFFEVTERSRLSIAALETLAIVAYRQPITLPEIQDLRGVNSSAVVRTLLEKRLITTAGKKAVVGTPFLYRTTREFLVRFGLNDISELPEPQELEEDLAATAGDLAPEPAAAVERADHPSPEEAAPEAVSSEDDAEA